MANHKGNRIFTKRGFILTGNKVYVKMSIANSFVYDNGFLGSRNVYPLCFPLYSPVQLFFAGQ